MAMPSTLLSSSTRSTILHIRNVADFDAGRRRRALIAHRPCGKQALARQHIN